MSPDLMGSRFRVYSEASNQLVQSGEILIRCFSHLGRLLWTPGSSGPQLIPHPAEEPHFICSDPPCHPEALRSSFAVTPSKTAPFRCTEPPDHQLLHPPVAPQQELRIRRVFHLVKQEEHLRRLSLEKPVNTLLIILTHTGVRRCSSASSSSTEEGPSGGAEIRSKDAGEMEIRRQERR